MHQRLSDYDTSKTYQAKVVETERITPENGEVEVRHIVLDIDDPAFDWVEGQNIGLLAPAAPGLGAKNHFRLYSIASSKDEAGGKNRFAIAVRRCFYIDDFSGEKEKGVASNFLCDRQPGDVVTITGPYGGAFALPTDPNINLLMIGMGTGIAPFRAFIKKIYKEQSGNWKGKVRLFYGAKQGMELLYMNDVKNDFANYYDQESFKAFESLSPRPAMGAPVALDRSLEENEAEVWAMIKDPLTNVYVAGLASVQEALDKAMSKIADSEEVWRRTKEDLKSKSRWFELIY